jgi:hypothetical protein
VIESNKGCFDPTFVRLAKNKKGRFANGGFAKPFPEFMRLMSRMRGTNSGTIWFVDFYGKKSPKVESGNRSVASTCTVPGSPKEFLAKNSKTLRNTNRKLIVLIVDG